jgi:hypothetical protein
MLWLSFPDLHLAGVPAGGERSDHTHQVSFAEPLQLGDDLVVEAGMAER